MSSSNICNTCNVKFSSAAQAVTHAKNYHRKSNDISYIDVDDKIIKLILERDENEKLTCPICFIQVKPCSTLRSHLQRTQGNCGEGTKSLKLKINGVEMYMQQKGDGSYRCVLCHENTIKIEEHMTTVHSNFKIDVQECSGKRTTSNPNYDDLFYDYDNDFKRHKANPIMKAFGLDLVKLEVPEEENTIITTALVHKEAARLWKSLPKPTDTVLGGAILSGNVETASSKELTADGLKHEIKKSNFPLLYSKLGSYVELDETIEDQLGSLDINAIVTIFAGAIIMSDDFSLLILTAEIYSRNGYIDAHAERSGDSFPEIIDTASTRYNHWKICVVQEGEGGDPISKLVIGSESFNILVTGSLIISPITDNALTFGPRCNTILCKDKFINGSLFFQQSKLKKLDEPIVKKVNHVQCRQLNSAFSHKSTYFTYRANLFQSNLRQPATLFTLYLLPNNGYGSTSSNSLRDISRFFSFIFDCYHGTKNIKDINVDFHEPSKQKKLQSLIQEIKQIVDENEKKDEEIDILQALSEQTGISPLAQSLSGSLTTANKKLAENSYAYLKKLFNR